MRRPNQFSNAVPLSPAWRRDFRELYEAAMTVHEVARRDFWRAANKLPTYKPWVDALFRVRLGELPSDGGPEHPLNIAGAAFWAEAHTTPEYTRLKQAEEAQTKISRAFMGQVTLKELMGQ